jgi:hypothetical protein
LRARIAGARRTEEAQHRAEGGGDERREHAGVKVFLLPIVDEQRRLVRRVEHQCAELRRVGRLTSCRGRRIFKGPIVGAPADAAVARSNAHR